MALTVETRHLHAPLEEHEHAVLVLALEHERGPARERAHDAEAEQRRALGIVELCEEGAVYEIRQAGRRENVCARSVMALETLERGAAAARTPAPGRPLRSGVVQP